MGIPKLNKFLLDHCSQQSIYKIHFENLYEKRVVVDISIYLYRFLATDNFMEHVYLFLSVFKYYCIEPVFIFDGKPPAEKSATIKKRNSEKQAATVEYSHLETQLTPSLTYEARQEMERRMIVLKKKMLRITWTHIDNAIELIDAFGFQYYLAPHEADQLCVYLARCTKFDIYAVISDDMDMILSGCPRVIRGINISLHEGILYDTTRIMSDLDVSLDQFRQIVVLTGTDYDSAISNKNACTIPGAFDMYKQYTLSDRSLTFYDWISERETNELLKICDMFDVSNYTQEIESFLSTGPKKEKKFDIPLIKSIMKRHNFYFL